MTAKEAIGKLQQVKPYLQKEYAVKTLGLFGSFTDGTHTESSDVDVLVEFEHPIGWKFFTLEKYLEDVMGRKIDLVTKNALKEGLKMSILNQVKYV